LPKGSGFVFENAIVGGVVPSEFIPAVEQGVREAMENGVLAGYPLVDIKVRLVDGSYHEVDSSEMAFKIAGSIALREGAEKAAPVLLEPVMKVEVVAPEQFTGAIIGDLTARRGQILGLEPHSKGMQSVRAIVPLAEMFGYATDLRSATEGRGTFTMEFDRYEPISPDLAEEIISGKRR